MCLHCTSTYTDFTIYKLLKGIHTASKWQTTHILKWCVLVLMCLTVWHSRSLSKYDSDTTLHNYTLLASKWCNTLFYFISGVIPQLTEVWCSDILGKRYHAGSVETTVASWFIFYNIFELVWQKIIINSVRHQKKTNIFSLTSESVCVNITTGRQTDWHAKEPNFCPCDNWGHIWHESCSVNGTPVKTITCLQALSQHRCRYLWCCLNKNKFCHVCLPHTTQHAQMWVCRLTHPSAAALTHFTLTHIHALANKK